MTQTNITPKVSFISPSQKQEEASPEKAQASAVDSYAPSSSNAYKGLVTGSFKAEALPDGILSDMLSAEEEMRSGATKDDYYGRVQQIIYRNFIGDADVREQAPRDYKGDIPDVPDFKKDIGYLEDYEPVVERYAGLERILIALATNVDTTISKGILTAGEMRSLQAHRARIEQALGECRKQMEVARDQWRVQVEARREANADDD